MSQDINEIIQSGHQPLPCPLCGGRAYAFWSVNGEQMFKVGCAPCGLELKAAWYRGTEKPTKDILTLWNTRALPPSSPVADSDEIDEEEVPHPFRSRTRYEPGDDRDIWCADCEYHRDYRVHTSAPSPSAGAAQETTTETKQP